MALGSVTVEVQAGGGRASPSAASVAKTVVVIAPSPKGTVNGISKAANVSAAVGYWETGPLAECAAKLLQHDAPEVVGVPVNPSVDGDYGAVTQVGTGTGSVTVSVGPHKVIDIECITGGAIATATYKFRVGGSTAAWSDVVTSSDTGGGNFVYRVPGTFCTLTFAAAVYVATKTCNVATDGTVTNGAGWVGVVTQASSPIDYYRVKLTVAKAGGVGTAILAVSLDNGNSSEPNMLVPAGGVVVLPGTGLVLTLANTFVIDDTYSFLAAPPGFSTSDITSAMTALRADTTIAAALVYVTGLPTSGANSMSFASTLNTAITTAKSSNGYDWQGMVDCPYVGDTIVTGGVAVANSASTTTQLRTDRAAQASDLDYTSVVVSTEPIDSPLTGRKVHRPHGWAIASRFVETNPSQSVSEVAAGPLDVYAKNYDEFAINGLDDVGYNVPRTYPGLGSGVYQSITSGGYGWKNLTGTDAYQDAEGVRALNLGLRGLRAACAQLIGKRPQTNADGTIEEKQARRWDKFLDGAFKRSLGLAPGGEFVDPQASIAEAVILRTSQVGNSPHRVDVQYTLIKLGFVSSVSAKVRYSGTLSFEV